MPSIFPASDLAVLGGVSAGGGEKRTKPCKKVFRERKMEPLDYDSTPKLRRLPKWFKISGGLLILVIFLAILAIAAIIFLLWLCLWLMQKIAPML